MHIQSKEVYQARFDYDPIEGAINHKGTNDSAVEYRKFNRAVVRVEIGEGVVEDQPAAIIAWLLSDRKWSYGTMIISENGDLGDITLENLSSMPKSVYEASRRGNTPQGVLDAISLCNLGLNRTLDPIVALEGVRKALETFVKK